MGSSPDATGTQRTAAEDRAVAGWSIEAWERENAAAIAEITPLTDEDLVRLDQQRAEAEAERLEEFSVRWRAERDARRRHEMNSLAVLIAFGPAGGAARAARHVRISEEDWPRVLRVAQRISALPLGRRQVLTTVGRQRARRAHCGGRRRPGVRRTVSRSAGGGSSGDPDEAEPAEHGRRTKPAPRSGAGHHSPDGRPVQ